MGSSSIKDSTDFFSCQLVAIPYPGRGHINQLMNFCKLITKKRSDFLIHFVVTEEWLGFLASEPDPGQSIRFATIPNVIPSEKVRAKEFQAFFDAIMTKMEGPFEYLLNQLDPPKPRAIIYDSFLKWVLGVANRRFIPAASFWPMSATFFTVLYHFQSLVQNGQLPANPLENGEHRINCIPGIPSIRVADFPRELLEGKLKRVIEESHEFVSFAAKADYLLLTSVYEMESQAIKNLKKELPCPVYPIGLSIPPLDIINGHSKDSNNNHQFSWLDAQPEASVLYISQGSFLSASEEQLNEYIAGVGDSGIRFFWVARENRERFVEQLNGGGGDPPYNGLVVDWCDQLRVLSHPSICGFWSHCGWNSAKEAAFSGLPVLASPIAWDQNTNSKQIVEDWGIGWRLKESNDGRLVGRGEISRILKRFMDSESEEVEEMRRRAHEIGDICGRADSECGSSDREIEAFIENVSK
ncbi:OLC1v1006335C1 [Oldenlandia corymbosa var. corymbosa]|uniref:OLC1v1006335C1 n=1 Tax=Oldenlandia corymbosa var. corymbosa TaxID=529605 RepID=A0AAV1DH28_OLDCO|nr:OLC1v1006335C1 [Oldenlandia corymbosa var. corymbosa]